MILPLTSQNLVTKLYKGFWENAHFSGKSCVWVIIEVLLLMNKIILREIEGS